MHYSIGVTMVWSDSEFTSIDGVNFKEILRNQVMKSDRILEKVVFQSPEENDKALRLRSVNRSKFLNGF